MLLATIVNSRNINNVDSRSEMNPCPYLYLYNFVVSDEPELIEKAP